VTRASGTTGTVSVDYATQDGTAKAGLDYVAKSDTLTFGPGVTSRTIDIPILNDNVVEGNETFTLTLSGNRHALINGGATATITILDDEIPASRLLVATPASTVAGTPFDVTVSALDPYGNFDKNYTGTVSFVSTDTAAGVVLPANYTFTTADAGVHLFGGGAT